MKFLKSIPLLFLGLMAAVAPLNTAHADDSVMDDGIGQVVNVAKNTTDALKDASTSIADFMAKTTDEKALDILVASLKKAGMNPTWAKQIGSLRKFLRKVPRKLQRVCLRLYNWVNMSLKSRILGMIGLHFQK